MVPPLLIEQAHPFVRRLPTIYEHVRAILLSITKMLIGTLNQKDLLRGSLTTSND